jgi:RimJ/RimL family protein N-acetyltransferase
MEFYPTGLPVPQEKRSDRLYLRPLRATDVELDYEAVMSSAEMLRRWSQSDWPTADFTLAQNLADLQRHEREHLDRKAFTFTVLNPQGTQCLGCVYIMPVRRDELPLCPDAAYAADVGFWVRTSELPNALDQHLLATLLDWFQAEWALDCVLFTISQQESRQAALFAAAGLQRRSACTLFNGNPYWVFS